MLYNILPIEDTTTVQSLNSECLYTYSGGGAMYSVSHQLGQNTNTKSVIN